MTRAIILREMDHIQGITFSLLHALDWSFSVWAPTQQHQYHLGTCQCKLIPLGVEPSGLGTEGAPRWFWSSSFNPYHNPQGLWYGLNELGFMNGKMEAQN